MSDDDHRLVVSRRNGATVEQVLREMRSEIVEQNKRLDAMVQGMSAFAIRVAEMERALSIHKALSIGSGPTVAP